MHNEDIPPKPNGFALKSRGRPKDRLLRLRIIESATSLFLEHGMQAVSIESIASHAQVSNRTIYSHFQNKEALLWEVLVHAGEKMRPVRDTRLPKSTEEFRLQLVDFGVAFTQLLTSPTIVQLGKLMMSEAARHPQLAKQFFDWGPKQVQTALTAMIQVAVEHGLIDTKTDPRVSHHLLAMLQGTRHFEQQLQLCGPMTKTKIKKHVEECVGFFMNAIASC
jgi:TetR/AcrR family transcriptional regulator, mexJK operon transcriptional repressor